MSVQIAIVEQLHAVEEIFQSGDVDENSQFFYQISSSLLKILPHQHQYRLHHRLPRPGIGYPRDLFSHIDCLRGYMCRAFGVDIERLECRSAGQHQQLVGVDPPMIRQQNAHRHVGTITGANTADGLVIKAGT